MRRCPRGGRPDASTALALEHRGRAQGYARRVGVGALRIMLLVVVILCLVAIAAIWVCTWFFSLPIWIGIVVTAASVLLVVGIIVFRRIRAVMRAAALERELLKQASQQADRANPQKRAQILELQSSMRAAIASLKTTKLG